MRSAILMASVLLVLTTEAGAGEIRAFFTASRVDGKLPNSTAAGGATAPGLLQTAAVWNHVSFAVTSNDSSGMYTDNKDYSSTVATQRFRISTFPTYSTSVPSIFPNGFDGIPGTSDDEFVYMWVQFYNESVPGIRSWRPGIFNTTFNSYNGVNATWYKQDNMGGGSVTGNKRWANASTEADNYAAFRNNPQMLDAGTNIGIPNAPLDDNGEAYTNRFGWNLYQSDIQGSANYPDLLYRDDGTHTRIALVGAFQPTDCGVYTTTLSGELDCFGTVANSDFVSGSFAFPIPEPASLLLVGVLALARRR